MSEKELENDKNTITEQDRDLAQNALFDFQNSLYTNALQNLIKLENSRPQDIKVLHNKAVAEYYKSDLKKTDAFRKNLILLCSQAHLNIEAIDDVEHCVIFYNQAVLLYHLKQYSSALKITKKIFSFIEPMEETLAHRVCLLLIELHLCTYQPEKALSLILYIENQFVSTELVITAEKDIKPLEKDHKEKKHVCTDSATEAFRVKLLQYRARCYLAMHALKSCKRELKTIVTSGGQSFMALPSIFLKANLEYLRGNFKKSMKVLSSVPLNSLSFKETGECLSTYFYNNNGCIHHYMRKPNLACFYFQKALYENETALNSLPIPDPSEPYSGRPLATLGSNRKHEIMYNLGVSLLHARKPTQAFDCLLEAVQVYHVNPRLWLRLSECCIMANKPTDNQADLALDSRRRDMVHSGIGQGIFRKLILNPKLGRDDRYISEGLNYALPLATLEFSSLCLRNALLLLPSSAALAATDNSNVSSAINPSGIQTPAGMSVSQITLGVESSSLTNTVNTPNPMAAAAAVAASAPSGSNYSAPSPLMSLLEVESLRCSILAASAYASLCLGDFVIALEHAKALLARPKKSTPHKLLGHLYAAEALIMLDQISEAIQYLDLELVGELWHNVWEKDPSTLDKNDLVLHGCRPLTDWFPNNDNTAILILKYNFAVAFAIRGEMDKASEMLHKVFNVLYNCTSSDKEDISELEHPWCPLVWALKQSPTDVPVHMVMLALYIELQLGHADSARSIIKQHLPQYK